MELKWIGAFKCLGTILSPHDSQYKWHNWKNTYKMDQVERAIRSIVWKGHASENKGRDVQIVVRSGMIHGAEALLVGRVNERRMKVAEMRLLQYMFGEGREDKISNVGGRRFRRGHKRQSLDDKDMF